MPEIATSERQVYRHPKATVYVNDALRDQDFAEVVYLRCDVLRIAAAPEIDQCRLSYIYGNILREDDPGPGTTVYAPESLNGLFVKVVITDTVYEDDPEDPKVETDQSITWFGVIEFDQRETAGTTPDPENTPQGEQLIFAYGLPRLLQKEVMRTSLIDTDGTQANQFTARSGLTFNLDPGGQFVQRGNRSADRVTNEAMEDLTYLFSWDPRGLNEWTAFTAVEYLLANHTPKDAAGDPANVWRLEADEDYLDWYDVSEQTDGRTVKELLDALIPRYRGVGYWCWFDIERTDPEDPETAANEIVVEVFTFNKTDVVLANGRSLKANTDQYSIDFEHAVDIVEATVSNTFLQRFHRIVARGARRTTTFTVRIGPQGVWGPQAILGPAWTSDDQTEYKEAASGAADYASLSTADKQRRNAIYRQSSDRLREVFRRFVLNPHVAEADRWDGQIPHPHSLEIDLPFWWLRGDQTNESDNPNIVDPESDYDGRDYVPDLRVMRGLPLYESFDYSGTALADFQYGASFTDEKHPSFIPLMVYARTTEGDAEFLDLLEGETPHRYELLDRLHQAERTWSCRVHVGDTEPAIEIDAGIPHLIASETAGSVADGYAATEDQHLSSVRGGLPYTDIWATVCVELTEHVERELVLSDPPAGAPESVLIVNVPDARHDYVIPHTTVGITDGLIVETSSGGFAKDDTLRLDSIAEAAAQWYSLQRQTLDLRWKQIRATFQLGWLITDVGGQYQLTNINTPITAITYELGGQHQPGQSTTGTTKIETAFCNQDFQTS